MKTMIKLNPLTTKKLRRFRSIKRGYWSFIFLVLLYSVSLLGELFVNKRALIVSYQGEFFFPTYGEQISGKEFGFDYEYETNYRDLQKKFKKKIPTIGYSCQSFPLAPMRWIMPMNLPLDFRHRVFLPGIFAELTKQNGMFLQGCFMAFVSR
jgi:hypothetical protein